MFRPHSMAVVVCAGLSAALWTTTADASVDGNCYSVIVFTNFTGQFQDVLTFESGGPLVSESGPVGLWTETTYGPISNWMGNLSTIQLAGWQFGPALVATGQDDRGHKYILFGRRTL